MISLKSSQRRGLFCRLLAVFKKFLRFLDYEIDRWGNLLAQGATIAGHGSPPNCSLVMIHLLCKRHVMYITDV